MTEIDPYAGTNALGRGFNLAQGMDQSRARRQAGTALAGGDRAGARNALGGAGMLAEVEALDANDRRARQEQTQAEQQAREQMQQFLLRGATALRRAPEAQRGEVYQMLRPTLAQIYPADVMQQIDRAPLTDESLDSLLASLGAETQRFNTSRAVVEVGPGGNVRTLYETPRDPLDEEYRQAQIDATRALVPQRQAATAASNARAARSRVGGGSSGGSARPAAPAARSGVGQLPPGFTVRR